MAGDGFAHSGRGQGTRRHNRGRMPGQVSCFFSYQLNLRVAMQGVGNAVGEARPVNRQCAAGWHRGLPGAAHEHRTEQAHFRLQDASRAIGQFGAKRIAADQLRQAVADMRAGLSLGAHFI